MPTAESSFLYIIKTGNAIHDIAGVQGDFDDWIRAGLLAGLAEPQDTPFIQVVDPRSADHARAVLPDITHCAGIVVTGSHAMVTDAEPWMVELGQWLQEACTSGVPVLGICFGHQLVAHALGGQVGPHPDGLELGTVPVAIKADVSDDPLWQDMPAEFDANAVHYQTVLRLPAEATALAGNLHEPHHGFRWKRHVWGVQFHPEFSVRAMQAYVDHVQADRERTSQHSLESEGVLCRDTPVAARILPNFARHVQALTRHPDAWGKAA